MSNTKLTIKEGRSALWFSDGGVSQIINGHVLIRNSGSRSILMLPERDEAGEVPFRRHLVVDHRQIYFYGNSCGTCPFMFQKVGSTQIKLTPYEVSNLLRQGPAQIGIDLVQTISTIVPDGKYMIGYFEVDLEEVTSKTHNDPIAEMYWARHERGGPKTSYYRSKKRPLNVITSMFELVLPIFSDRDLSSRTVREYQRSITNGEQPTALAISLVQQRLRMEGPGGEVPTDVCLIHFLLDGHHKIKAAAKIRRPIKLLSFLSLNESLGGVKWLEEKL